MAKLNLSYQQHQPENPFVLAIFGSVGVLMCLVVTVMGIKLWWFKHRLSFEQTTLQNGAAGGGPPNVVVTRRQKKSRFSKDKRWSQQVYSSVDVHGVFKQKKEDDLDIQQPTQLPPVRLKKTDSAPALLLAPPRNKRRPEYVQSTAFEDLRENYDYNSSPSPAAPQKEAEALIIAPTISIALPPAEDPGISLTFEEVEKELKPPCVAAENVKIPLEIAPEPPKRLNRSSSASLKPEGQQEKPHRFLKSSQSISVPEFRKVIERRPTGFHRPTEDDLTKIDDLEEPQFEKFGDRRPTGYIKYEEVDVQANLRDFRELNLIDTPNYVEIKHFYDSGHLEKLNVNEPIEALRNEEIIYQNPVSPDITEINKTIEDFEKSTQYSNKMDDLTKYSKYSSNDLSKTSPPGYSYTGGKGINGKDNYDSRENEFEIYDKAKRKVNFTEKKENANIFEPNFGNDSKLSNKPDNTARHEKVNDIPHLTQRMVSFEDNFNENESLDKSTLNQRRPTAYVRNLPNWESAEDSEYCETRNYAKTKSCASPCHELQVTEEAFTNASELHTQHVKFQMEDVGEKFTLNQRRPTEFVRTVLSPLEAIGINPQTVTFDANSFQTEGNEDKFTLNQRRPTEFVRNEIPLSGDVAMNLQQTVTFDVNGYQTDVNEDKFTLNQRRPTTYARSNLHKDVYEEKEVKLIDQSVRFNLDTNTSGVEGDEDKSTLNQRRLTAYVHSKQEEFQDILQHSNVTFDLRESSMNSQSNENKFTLNLERLAVSKDKDNVNLEKETFDSKESKLFSTPTRQDTTDTKLALNPSETFKSVEFKETDVTDGFTKNVNEDDILKSSGPIAPVRMSPKTETLEEDTDITWQEMENDLEFDFAQNVEEEFARIRQSFELNEADFLEIKDELQLASPTLFIPNVQSPTGFGKSIEDDWENFEKLKKADDQKMVESIQEIRVTYNKDSKKEDVTTVSILKETKQEPSKLRKSKVTFDSKTEEHLIPARKSPSDEEDTDSEEDDDSIYNKPPPPIPMQRFISLNYTADHVYEPVVSPPTSISLFSSQISEEPEEHELEDSWSAIQKHRDLTSQFQHLTLDSPTSPPPPSHPPPPLPLEKDLEMMHAPKPAYRNPLAQLAIERAKEVRSDMEGFKSRSIKDAKKMQAKRSSQEVLKLNEDFEDTEA